MDIAQVIVMTPSLELPRKKRLASDRGVPKDVASCIHEVGGPKCNKALFKMHAWHEPYKWMLHNPVDTTAEQCYLFLSQAGLKLIWPN